MNYATSTLSLGETLEAARRKPTVKKAPVKKAAPKRKLTTKQRVGPADTRSFLEKMVGGGIERTQAVLTKAEGSKTVGKLRRVVSGAYDAFGMAQAKAEAFGFKIPGPMMPEQKALQGKLDGLKKARLRLEGIRKTEVSRYMKLSAPDGKVLAEKLSKAVNQSVAQLRSGEAALSGAMDAANSAKRSMTNLRNVGSTYAVYEVKRRQAEVIADKALARAKETEAFAEEVKRKVMDFQTGIKRVVKTTIGVGKATWGTATEFGEKMVTGAEKVGEAAMEAGKGAAELVPYARFLPVVLLIAGGAYIYMQLPKGKKA
jgi:hypothetical protein